MENQESNGGFLDNYKQVFVELKSVDDELDALAIQEKTFKQRRAELEERLVTAMDDADVPRITVAGTTFFRRTDHYPMVEDQDALFKYLQGIDRGELIKPTVNAQSLRSLMLEQMKDNQPVPDCIKLKSIPRVQSRTSK